MPQGNPHQLTRDQMHQILDRKESVMLPNGRIITEKHHLPGEAELATMLNDPVRKAAAQEDMRQQIETMQAQLKAIQSGQPIPAAPAPENQAAAREALLTGNPPAPAAAPEAPAPAPAAPAQPEAKKK